MTTLTPLGHLSVLPREIRDQVYYQLIAKHYRGYYSNAIIRPANYGKHHHFYTLSTRRRRKTYTGLVILRLSKVIHEEAMPILYTRSIFNFEKIFVYGGPSSPIPKSLNTKITDRLMKIEIGYNMELDDRPLDYTEVRAQQYRASRFFCKAPSGPLEIFRAGDVQRNSMTVMLELDDWASYAFKLKTSPLFLAIKEFTMFRSVILRLSIAPESYCPAVGTTQKVIKEWEAAEQCEELYAGLNSVLRVMSKSLEVTPDPAVPSARINGANLADYPDKSNFIRKAISPESPSWGRIYRA